MSGCKPRDWTPFSEATVRHFVALECLERDRKAGMDLIASQREREQDVMDITRCLLIELEQIQAALPTNRGKRFTR